MQPIVLNNLDMGSPRIIPVKFGKNPMSGFREELV